MDFRYFEIIQHCRRHNKMGVRWCSLGSSRRHNLSIENPNALPRPCYLARLHGDAFLPDLVTHARLRMRVTRFVPYPTRDIFRAATRKS